MEDWNRLREIFGDGPSERGWEALCTLLEAWPASEDRPVAVSYAKDHLETWPDSLRALPERWVHDPMAIEHPLADLARVSVPAEGAGYLIEVAPFDQLEAYMADHGELPLRQGALRTLNDEGQRLSLNERTLELLGPDGDTIAVASIANHEPSPHEGAALHCGFSSCGLYVWLLGYEGDQSTIRLLDRETLSPVDSVPLLPEDMDDHWCDNGWDDGCLCVSPDGRAIGYYDGPNDDVACAVVFWQEAGQIRRIPTPPGDGDPGVIIGFSPDNSRYALLETFGCLDVFSLPEGELQEEAGYPSWDSDDMPAYFCEDVGTVYGETFLIVLLEGMGEEVPCGISVHDPVTGRQLGAVFSHEQVEMHNERIGSTYEGSVWRFLPSLSLLSR